MLIWKNILFEADKGNNGASEDGKQTGDATGTNGGEKPFAVFTSEKEFQEAIERRLKDRLEREQKKAETQTQKAREEAESKALADQAKFQELADKRGKQVTDLETTNATLTTQLETVTAKADRHEKALLALLAEQLKAVPEHLHSLLSKLDAVEQLEWIAGNADKMKTATNGVPPTPKPAVSDGFDKDKALKDAERFYRSRF